MHVTIHIVVLYKKNFSDISGIWLNKFWSIYESLKIKWYLETTSSAGLSHFADREVMVQKYERDKSTDANLKKSADYPYPLLKLWESLGLSQFLRVNTHTEF